MPRLRVRVSHLRLKDVSAIHFLCVRSTSWGFNSFASDQLSLVGETVSRVIVRLVYVGVVQLVEHLLAKQDVAGSIPVIHSKGLPIVSCYWEVCQLWRAEFKYAPDLAVSVVNGNRCTSTK